MKITCWPLGPFETNGYFFMHRGLGFLVDPGDPEIADFLNEMERVDWILLTHGHVDHVLGIDAVKRRFPQARIALSVEDRALYEKTDVQAAIFGLQRQPVPPPDLWLSPPCAIEGIQVIATPGHTPGGVCYFIPEEGELFSGDTLFAGSVGRTDFPGGSQSRLKESIRGLYRDLAPGTRVYPGHGPATTIEEERRSNPFVSDRRL